MIIKPRTRGFICTTSHPVGREAQVQEQIDYVLQQPGIEGPRNVLVIGASTGYGLSARIRRIRLPGKYCRRVSSQPGNREADRFGRLV